MSTLPPAIKLMSTLLLVAFSAISHTDAERSQSDSEPWQLIVQLDNDLFAGEDKDYTNGFRIGFVKELNQKTELNRLLEKQLYRLSGADEDKGIMRWRIKDRENLRFAYGAGLTQLMFTPDDYTTATTPDGERPYAGWLGLEFSLHVKNSNFVSSATISIGTTGENSFAEESQEWVHENISDSPVYQGWDSQVPDQITLNLHLDHKQRLTSLNHSSGGLLAVDGYYEWGAALGNFRSHAYVGALIRAGHNLPATYSTPRVQLGSYGHQLFRDNGTQNHRLSLLMFAGLRATAVAYDITIDGPLFDDFDTGVESKPLVGEIIFGVGLRYSFFDISFSHTIRTDEFYGQDKNQEFGSVMLRFNSIF